MEPANLRARLPAFAQDRDRDPLHRSVNLAMGLAAEAGELLESAATR